MAEGGVSSTNTTVLQQPTPRDVGYFIANIISIASIYKELVSDEEEKSHAINYITTAFDKWLELVSPIEYIPGLVEKLDKIIKNPFWEIIPDLGEDLFERILVESIVFKEESLGKTDPVILEALAETLQVHTILLLEKLSGSKEEAWKIVEEVLSSATNAIEVIRKTISIAAVALSLSMNRHERT